REPPRRTARRSNPKEVPKVELFAHVMLADHVDVAGNKLFINGGGWTIRPPVPIPWGLAVQVFVPWGEMNRKFLWKLELVDGDGQLVEFETPEGPKPMSIDGDFKVTP